MVTGLRAFDVASAAEMASVRAADPEAVPHYKNPVRSRGEVAQVAGSGSASASIDDPGELARLAPLTGIAVSARPAIPSTGCRDDTPLPDTIAEGDYLLFSGMGAYSLATGTRFNGYGLGDPVAVRGL